MFSVPTTYLDTPLGKLYISVSGNFISRVMFTEPENNTTLSTETHPLLDTCVSYFQNYFSGKTLVSDLPVLQEGSAFCTKVWSALQQIRPGDKISYQSLAKKMLSPTAVRAVAKANSLNQISILVPCHRVVGSDGSLTGYNGGLWRKQWLLQHEAKFIHGANTLF